MAFLWRWTEGSRYNTASAAQRLVDGGKAMNSTVSSLQISRNDFIGMFRTPSKLYNFPLHPWPHSCALTWSVPIIPKRHYISYSIRTTMSMNNSLSTRSEPRQIQVCFPSLDQDHPHLLILIEIAQPRMPRLEIRWVSPYVIRFIVMFRRHGHGLRTWLNGSPWGFSALDVSNVLYENRKEEVG